MLHAKLWYPGGRTPEDDRRATSEHLSSSLHNLLASRASFLLENFLDKKRARTSNRLPARAEFAVELLVLIDVMYPAERRLCHGILHQLGHLKDCFLADNKLVQPDLILPAPIAEPLQHFHFQLVPES